MKPYFFLLTLCFLMNSQLAFSADYVPYSSETSLAYPAVALPKEIAEKIFVDKARRYINCPLLFDNSWSYPNGSTIALCEDAQLACLRYGLLVQKMKTSKGKLLEELKKTLVLEKNEVSIRLRGCELTLELTISSDKMLQEVAGYPTGPYGYAGQEAH